jgi:DNA adenine methylase
VSPRTLKRPQFSPLRYPGGKSALFGLVSATIRENGVSGGTYVEPYAGGAGIALGLLLTEQVERVVINDLDPAIHAFWVAATQHTDELVSMLSAVELSVREWERQRATYLAADQDDPLSLGFATFFLNRTNRSGVLNAGVIGGKDQTGPYKMDARFNRDGLIQRCRLIGLYSSRIRVERRDGRNVIADALDAPRTFLYADPPYYEKGSQLYLNAFNASDHAALADDLNAAPHGMWMLTYDAHSEIEALYRNRKRFDVGVYYSVREARRSSELLVTSDSLKLPDGFVTPR